MKKIAITAGLLFFSIALAFAQKIELVGTVNDAKGTPIPYAFVKDANHNYATYTDAFGGFVLKVDIADRLLISADNFEKTTINISDPQKIMIALANSGTTNKKTIDPDMFKEKLSNEGMTRNSASGYIAHENNLHGSRYLFDHWVHGFAISNEDSLKQNDGYLYNYEKVDGDLLVTDDGKSMKQIDKNLLKMFTLFDGQDTYTFENVAAIDPKHFVQVLSNGSKYKIYKLLGTKFFPNDYVSNGLTSTGHNYDEIKDEPVYYAVKLPAGQPQKFALKAKALKAAFPDDVAKVSKYLSDNESDIDDNYLKGLGDYLNN